MRNRSDSVAHAQRNEGIDALRGFSILFVIMNHIGIRLPLAKTTLVSFIPKSILQDLNYFGYESVFVFFVISGFLITRRSMQRWGELSHLAMRGFYVLRAARIVPCLLLVIALLSVLHLLGVPSFVIDRAGQSLPAAIASALGLYLNWYEGVTGYLPGGWDVLWSLSIEELFYLAFPLLCLTLGRKTWLFALALGVLALSLPFTHATIVGNEIWQEKAYLPGMSAIAIGVLTALLAAAKTPSRRWVAPLLCWLGMLGLFMILFLGLQVWNALKDGYLLVLTGSAASLVLGLHWQAVAGSPWRGRGLGWLRSCGRLSYEIYLFHMFSVFAVVNIANASGLGREFGYVWYLPIIGLAWILGFAVARGFSEPCDRWLRRRFAPRAAAAVAALIPATAAVIP